MPNLLPIVMKKNNEKNLGLTFSQMKKSARRFEKRCEGWLVEDAEAYVMGHSDETGEIACGFKENPFADNHSNAGRRIHHRSKGPVRLDPDVREFVDVVGAA